MFNCAWRYSYSNIFSSTHKKEEEGTGREEMERKGKGKREKERKGKKKGRRGAERPRLRDWGSRGEEEGAIVGTLLISP